MVSGGYDPEGVPSRKVEAYNPETFEWNQLADLPHAARDHQMCAVPGASLESNRTTIAITPARFIDVRTHASTGCLSFIAYAR